MCSLWLKFSPRVHIPHSALGSLCRSSSSPQKCFGRVTGCNGFVTAARRRIPNVYAGCNGVTAKNPWEWPWNPQLGSPLCHCAPDSARLRSLCHPALSDLLRSLPLNSFPFIGCLPAIALREG